MLSLKEQAVDFIRWRKRRNRSRGQRESWETGLRSVANHTPGVDTLMANAPRLSGALKDFAWKEGS